MMTDELVVDPVLRMRSTFTEVTGDAGEPVMRVETWVDPGGGVTPHIHPAMHERFEVIEGECQLLSGRRWRTYGPGEVADIAPGTRHAFRNRSGTVTRFVCHATPPSTLEPFLTDAAALSRAGGITRRALPRSFDALLQAAVMAEAYRDMVVLLAPLPPPAIQRFVMPALARLGRRRGHRPGSIGQR